MTPPGRPNHRISLDAARDLCRRHGAKAAKGGIVGHALDRGVIDEILAQPGCTGVRIYHAEKKDGQPTLVVVGIDAKGNDLANGTIAEEMWPCPPWCGVTSLLAE